MLHEKSGAYFYGKMGRLSATLLRPRKTGRTLWYFCCLNGGVMFRIGLLRVNWSRKRPATGWGSPARELDAKLPNPLDVANARAL